MGLQGLTVHLTVPFVKYLQSLAPAHAVRARDFYTTNITNSHTGGEGTATGSTWDECEANCEAKCSSTCQTCNPNPVGLSLQSLIHILLTSKSLNFCDITTSCINTPKNDYCACRAGYRADGLLPTDPKQFRLAFPGQEYRVFVAPGVVCNTLCNNPFPGPISCQEVPVKDTC
jgi:hypothetical protein